MNECYDSHSHTPVSLSLSTLVVSSEKTHWAAAAHPSSASKSKHSNANAHGLVALKKNKKTDVEPFACSCPFYLCTSASGLKRNTSVKTDVAGNGLIMAKWVKILNGLLSPTVQITVRWF